jgi:hypothetical protein
LNRSKKWEVANDSRWWKLRSLAFMTIGKSDEGTGDKDTKAPFDAAFEKKVRKL